MKQDSAMILCDDGTGAAAGARAKRLSGANRRAQVLRTASAQFAMTGLHGTTTLTLAQAAGVSKAVLFDHFDNKTQLFRAAVEINTRTRLRSLDRRLSSIAVENQADWIECMAEATMMICVAGAANCPGGGSRSPLYFCAPTSCSQTRGRRPCS